MVTGPPPCPPAVEMLALIPFWSVNVPVARKFCSVVISTFPPTPFAPPWALIELTSISFSGSRVTFPPLPDVPLELMVPVLMLVVAWMEVFPPLFPELLRFPVVTFVPWMAISPPFPLVEFVLILAVFVLPVAVMLTAPLFPVVELVLILLVLILPVAVRLTEPLFPVVELVLRFPVVMLFPEVRLMLLAVRLGVVMLLVLLMLMSPRGLVFPASPFKVVLLLPELMLRLLVSPG